MLPRSHSGPLRDPASMRGVCQAWVAFSGNAGVILGSFNVASVTRNGTGDYTVAFVQPFADATGYAMAGMSIPLSSFDGYVFNLGTPTTTTCEVSTRSSANTINDMDYVSVAFWGNA